MNYHISTALLRWYKNYKTQSFLKKKVERLIKKQGIHDSHVYNDKNQIKIISGTE